LKSLSNLEESLFFVSRNFEEGARSRRAELGLMEWYDANALNPPWIEALAEVRRLASREGYCYHHVQAIIVSIDQYAESALGNREYFLNRPHGTG
jgi:hypothetical protein